MNNENHASLEQPSAEWSLEKLATFVREAGAESGRLEVETLKLGSRILRLHYDRGKALVVVRDEVLGKKREAWGRFRKENDFVGTTYDDDIRLYEAAYSWEEISAMGLTEARIYLGVTKPKVRKEAEPILVTTSATIPTAVGSAGSQAAPIVAERDMPSSDEPVSGNIAQPASPSDTSPPSVSGSVTSTDGPPPPEETLFKIVRRLEQLERDVQGRDIEACFSLIEEAVEVLGRLRGVATRKEVAA